MILLPKGYVPRPGAHAPSLGELLIAAVPTAYLLFEFLRAGDSGVGLFVAFGLGLTAHRYRAWCASA